MPEDVTHANVLDYAPPVPPSRWRRLLAIVSLYVACGLAGAFLGHLLTPPIYTAIALLDVRSNGPDATARIEQEQVQIAQGMLSASTIDSILSDASVAGYGYRVNDHGRSWVQQRLKAKPYANSRLVSITFTSHDPGLSVAAINAAIASVDQQPGKGWPNATVFAGPTLPPPRKGTLGTIAGMAVAMLTALGIHRWWQMRALLIAAIGR